MAFDIYPAVDEQYNFPKPVRQAIGSSSEVKATIANEITKTVTPIVEDVAANYIASNPAIIDAAEAAIDATPAMTELANRPKSRTSSLPSGTDLDTYYRQVHVGWWAFSKNNVSNAPVEMGTALGMLEVIAPQNSAAVQRVHDRNSRNTWERSIITTALGWSPWRKFAMGDETLMVRGVLKSVDLDDYYQKSQTGIYTLWVPFNTNAPIEANGRCTFELVVDANSSVVQRLTERESGDVWTRTRASDLTWTPWLRLTNSEMSMWKRALLGSRKKSTNVVIIGDSNTEGHGLENLRQRWINLLQKSLNAGVGLPSGAEFPFIPPRYIVSTPGGGCELSGSIGAGNMDSGASTGYGWRAVTLTGPDSKAKFTFVGTSFAVQYDRGYLGGVMSIVIDGDAPVLINTYSESYVGSSRWDSDSLSAGTHVVEITRHTSSGVTTSLYLQGLLTWNGDEDSGIRIIDGGRSGQRMSYVTPSKWNLMANTISKTDDVSAVIVFLGTNDERNGVSESAYRANAENIVDVLYNSYNFTGNLMFVIPWLGADNTAEGMRKYAQVVGDIAQKNSRVSFYYLGMDDMPDIPTPVTSLSSRGFYGDTLHLNPVGHKAVASRMYRKLTE